LKSIDHQPDLPWRVRIERTQGTRHRQNSRGSAGIDQEIIVSCSLMTSTLRLTNRRKISQSPNRADYRRRYGCISPDQKTHKNLAENQDQNLRQFHIPQFSLPDFQPIDPVSGNPIPEKSGCIGAELMQMSSYECSHRPYSQP
jgi:hypothetical protein